jgi:effector-binding domain-containing protein
MAIAAFCGSPTPIWAEDSAATPQAAPALTQPPSGQPSGAQTPSPPAQAQAPSPGQPPAAGSPAPAAPPAQAQTPPTSAEPPSSGAAKPAEGETPKSDTSTGETVELHPRPFAYVEGKADRDEVYGAIRGSLEMVKREVDKDGLKTAGPPIAVFVESDETGFRYHAGYPLQAAPDGKPSLSDAVKMGTTAGGKAMRFQHLGAYADIDATYDAITAYLDEKGIDAQDSFIEEYANDVKDADDPNLEVDIYVLLK